MGLYSVMAYHVSQRSQEIGLRMALGATRRDILGMMVGCGMLLTAVGVLIGLAGAFGPTRAIGTLLYEVRPSDPATDVRTPVLVALVALAACYVRRGARRAWIP